MTFHIVTIFPKIFDSYFSESIVRRAREKKLVDIKIHNLRDFATDKHKTVDDTPYGGGAGMVLKIEPIYKCLERIRSSIQGSTFPLSAKASNSSRSNLSGILQSRTFRTIIFSAKGKRYTQADAKRLSKYENIVMICGRYEGVDERVAKYLADEEISIGEYVLTGGEIPAMAVVDSITRLVPGALGNAQSPKKESFSKKNYLKHPQYTKPADFREWKVPEVLLGGNHEKIEKWRKKNSRKL
ncbi:MAG: tRNA (guanosine(37)-N1)-methyltransferase TrmD [Candidatus Moraniibacteriota bacterium]